MQASHWSAKIYVADPEAVDFEKVIVVFNTWIRDKVMDDVMIDVADYTHVPDGPGVILVCHEGILALENREGRLGLVYNRKRGGSDDAPEAGLSSVLKTVLEAAVRLQGDEALAGSLRFSGDELQIRLQNRLQAPNDADARAAVRPIVEKVAARLFDGAVVEVADDGEPRQVLGLRVKATGDLEGAGDIEAMLARL